MSDKEFVEFMQGIVIGIKDLPTKKQWKKIRDKLSTVGEGDIHYQHQQGLVGNTKRVEQKEVPGKSSRHLLLELTFSVFLLN